MSAFWHNAGATVNQLVLRLSEKFDQLSYQDLSHLNYAMIKTDQVNSEFVTRTVYKLIKINTMHPKVIQNYLFI